VKILKIHQWLRGFYIFYRTIGPNTSKEWWLEGKRSFPLLPRAIPYTAVTPVADAAAEAAGVENANLPHPQESKTDRVGVDGVNQKPVVLADPVSFFFFLISL
jgi:hypothetical protein